GGGGLPRARGASTSCGGLPAGGSHQQAFDARASGGWYDLTLQGTDGWLRRLAGRLEDGEHSVSDPLMGQG
ncbi:phospholipase domain-containing protein, partial [Serratia marcescens]|uniref:phospholipase domain-containing protein n=1 Tax=Serratia marcescens TaxID=615 RepID=UPI003B8967AC